MQEEINAWKSEEEMREQEHFERRLMHNEDMETELYEACIKE